MKEMAINLKVLRQTSFRVARFEFKTIFMKTRKLIFGRLMAKQIDDNVLSVSATMSRACRRQPVGACTRDGKTQIATLIDKL